ncbi:MAG: DsbE family thiol:disulfide interchange protein [Acidisphaera sp.]|nr:DsbE family thiol:disulfide interchange protein [Acidisphaera sp.]
MSEAVQLRRRLLLLTPLGVAAAGGVAFLAMLRGMQSGNFDPRGVPSPLVGRRIPDFSLPAQPPDGVGFGSADLLAAGRPVLVNFFASWCVPCVLEAPVLMQLKEAGVPIWGVAYKDQPDAAAQFLRANGDPYARLARDEPGRVAIDFGVYGVPESYFVDRSGIVRWRWAGGLSADTVSQELQPLLRKYA